jgi:NADPH-ferrihemoprotein reductase
MSKLSYKIIYATQSGNAQQFAEDLGKECKLKGIEFEIKEIDNITSIEEFNNSNLLVFIVSTFGDGEPTDDAVDFTDMIKQNSFWEKFNNKNCLFTVFGLGNSAFPKFNVQGKLFHQIFSQHMTQLCELGLGDDGKNLSGDFTMWKNNIFFPALEEIVKK